MNIKTIARRIASFKYAIDPKFMRMREPLPDHVISENIRNILDDIQGEPSDENIESISLNLVELPENRQEKILSGITHIKFTKNLKDRIYKYLPKLEEERKQDLDINIIEDEEVVLKDMLKSEPVKLLILDKAPPVGALSVKKLEEKAREEIPDGNLNELRDYFKDHMKHYRDNRQRFLDRYGLDDFTLFSALIDKRRSDPDIDEMLKRISLVYPFEPIPNGNIGEYIEKIG